MKRYVIVILLILPCIALGQGKVFKAPRVITEKDIQLSHRYSMCLDKNTYTSTQRLGFFPFNKAVKIKLISYNNATQNSPIIIDGESPKAIPAEDTMAVFTPMAPNKYHVNYHRVIEPYDLTPDGIDSLTDILLNVGFLSKKAYNYPDVTCNCYMPQDAILFIDRKGNTVQYIEFCFDCEHYNYSSSKIKLGEFCTQKFGILKAFFRNHGLKYGTAQLQHE
jgi:hypothetical protein